MVTLLIGTHNLHKVKEIAATLEPLGVTIKTLNDFPHIQPVDETGATLEANAELKAKFYAEATGCMTLADDTGLEVDALNGAPGVYSARYAGENCTYQDNNQKLMQALKNVPEEKRGAQFRCVIACYDPAKKIMELAQGKIEGRILPATAGQNGFGYDPVFYVTTLGKTLAELSLEEKNKISHRGLALIQAKKILTRWI